MNNTHFGTFLKLFDWKGLRMRLLSTDQDIKFIGALREPNQNLVMWKIVSFTTKLCISQLVIDFFQYFDLHRVGNTEITFFDIFPTTQTHSQTITVSVYRCLFTDPPYDDRLFWLLSRTEIFQDVFFWFTVSVTKRRPVSFAIALPAPWNVPTHLHYQISKWIILHFGEKGLELLINKIVRSPLNRSSLC